MMNPNPQPNPMQQPPPNAMNSAMRNIQPVVQNVVQGMSAAKNAITNTVQGAVSYLSPGNKSLAGNTTNSRGFSLSADLPTTTEPPATSANSSFFSFNSIFAKIAFLVFVVILFLMLVKLVMGALIYSYQSKGSPVLIDGLITASTPYTLVRNPQSITFVSLPRSNNQYYGSEFTWSVWLNVNELKTLSSNPREFFHVFNVGTKQSLDNGIMSVNNAPGVYLKHHTANSSQTGYSLGMRVVMDTEPYNDFNIETTDISSAIAHTTTVATQTTTIHNKTIDITDLPFNNWFNVIVRLENTVMDIYINGTIAGRINFETVPKQNFYDVQVCQNGGYQGLLSDLKYHSRALNIFDINAVVLAGPNLSSPNIQGAVDSTFGGKLNSYDYLATEWYNRR